VGIRAFSLLNVSGIAESALWSITRADAARTLFDRLTIDAAVFVLGNFGIVLLPALCAMFTVPKSLRVWMVLTTFSVLLFWFGTSSLTSYQPMPFGARMLLPMLPSACLLAGYFVSDLGLPYRAGK
jgi:hypothetical protein